MSKKIPCAVCDRPANETLEQRLARVHAWQDEQLKKYGFYVDLVMGGLPDGLVNIHTHGFPESVFHPDIQIVVNIGQQNAMAILHLIHGNLKSGKSKGYYPGQDYDDIAAGFKVRFIKARECDRDVCRLIVCDSDGNLDADKMNKPIFAAQYKHLDDSL